MSGLNKLSAGTQNPFRTFIELSSLSNFWEIPNYFLEVTTFWG